MKNHPSLFKDNSREWNPSLKQPLSLPMLSLTNLAMTLVFASFSQHLYLMLVVSVHRLHVWCRSRNKFNFISTTSFKVNQVSCLAFLCPAAELHESHLSLSPGFARFVSSGMRSQVFFRFVFQLTDFGVGFAVSSTQLFPNGNFW